MSSERCCLLYGSKQSFTYVRPMEVNQIDPEHFAPDQKASVKSLIKKKHKHIKISPDIVRCLSDRGESLNVTMIEDSRMVY
jgi:hypothetical protein